MNSKKAIIALDFPTAERALDFLQLFDQPLNVKVGMELYYGAGPQLIQAIKELGHSIFLDLKLHDIPHTVGSAMKVLASLGVDMVNVHAAGGQAMMEAARAGLAAGTPAGVKRPLLIAVTQLTSTSQAQMQAEQQIETSLLDSIVNYGRLTQAAGLDGVVCSPLESSLIHQEVGADFLTVTPGIRPASAQADDQKRITTPAQARKNGSDFIVVGRPITQADDPVAAYQRINDEWNQGGNKE